MDGEEVHSFPRLLESLSAVHEEQQVVIRKLTEENASLRSLLQKAARTTDSSVEFFRVSETTNRQPSLPESDVVVGDVGEPAASPSKSVRWGNSASVEADSAAVKAEDTNESQAPWAVPDLWPEWVSMRSEVSLRFLRSSITKLCVVEDTTGQAMTVVDSCVSPLVVRPNSAARLAWDFFSSLMVCYDVITIPLMAIALDREDLLGGGTGSFTDVMDWVTTIFWTIDLPCSFLTGYHSEGLVEMRPTEVAKHYVKTWFPFDFMIIFIDWAIVYFQQTARGAHLLGLFRAGKTARMARILRTVRLLRFVKLQRALCEALELINSESIRAVFNVALAMVFIFSINHYLACGFFLVGHVGRLEDQPNWIEENRIQDGTPSYAYFTSLHWSLTQFTPAGMEIRPYNIYERVYSIVCLMFALITFSSFLGSITASITQLRKSTSEAGRQQAILRSYFLRNRVSSALSKSIWKFLQANHFNHRTRHKGEVEILRLLPHHLYGRLHQELYGPYITRAPFFFHYMAFNSEGLMDVCSKAVTERNLICGESLFLEGKVAESMFFIASGYLKYEHCRVDLSQTIGRGSWTSEAVLWVNWVHAATLSAHTSAEIVALDSTKFRALMSVFKNSVDFVKVYAKLFHAHLEGVGPDNLSDIMTDVAGLEDLIRRAWYDVTSEQDQLHFKEMPEQEFPRTSRNRRIRTLIWQRQAETMAKRAWFHIAGGRRPSTGSS
mmetsp:Transcript_58347/g.170601  ORF Transcript_58347/g.170601 Transcript_58347/m.170601 type:complete len:722 (-) Transcript_58347:320-2485(-)